MTYLDDLLAFVDGYLAHYPSVRALEAGCGSASHLHISNAHWVGIDISEKQLARNSRLDDKILGDIQSHHFPAETFDVIVCWDVLEHLDRPELALEKFAAAARTNGLVILKAPNVMSFKGLLAKCLPYQMHVSFHRHLLGIKDAGRDDCGPFRTYLRFSISPDALRKSASCLGLKQIYFDTFDVDASYFGRKRPWAYWAYRLFRNLAWVVSLGKLGDSEFIIVLQKQPLRQLGLSELEDGTR